MAGQEPEIREAAKNVLLRDFHITDYDIDNFSKIIEKFLKNSEVHRTKKSKFRKIFLTIILIYCKNFF